MSSVVCLGEFYQGVHGVRMCFIQGPTSNTAYLALELGDVLRPVEVDSCVYRVRVVFDSSAVLLVEMGQVEFLCCRKEILFADNHRKNNSMVCRFVVSPGRRKSKSIKHVPLLTCPFGFPLTLLCVGLLGEWRLFRGLWIAVAPHAGCIFLRDNFFRSR